MTNFSAFIRTDYIKKNTPILEYVNEDVIQSFIRPAQDMHIKLILGNSFYDSLMSKITLSGNTLTQDEKDLLNDYVKPALQYWVVYEYIIYSAYKLTNKSVSKQNSDNSTPADFQEVTFLKQNIRDCAEFYTENLDNHLKDNSTKFPKYHTYTVSHENKGPKSNNYLVGGWYAPNHYDKYCPEPTPWKYFNAYYW